jgi:hypothetical protein
MVSLSGKTLLKGDTLGVYIHLDNPSGKLSYDRISQEHAYTGAGLTLLTGTGISHGFKNKYFPRNFSGEVFYHYGSRPFGACRKIKQAIALVQQPELDLGSDTTIIEGTPYVLGAPPQFVSYLWNTGTNQAFLVLNTDTMKPGTYQYWVQATNAEGCTAADTIEITIAPDPLAGISIQSVEKAIKVYPNPSSGKVNIKLGGIELNMLEIRTIQGQLVELYQPHLIEDLTIELPEGVYILHFYINNKQVVKQLFVRL